MNLSSRICRLHSSFLSFFASSFLLVLCLSLFPIQQHLSKLYSYVPYTSTEKIVTFSGFTGIAHREEHGAEMCPNKFEQYYHTFLQGLERNQHHPPLLNAIPGSVRFLNIMFIFSSSFLICIVGVNETKTLRSIITRSMTQKKIKYFFYIRRRSCNVRPRCPCPGRPQGCVSHPRWKLALDHGSFAGPPGFKIWVKSQERPFKSGWLLLANF